MHLSKLLVACANSPQTHLDEGNHVSLLDTLYWLPIDLDETMTYSEGATLLCVAARFDSEDVISELGRPIKAYAEGSGHTAHDLFLLGLRAEQDHFAGRNEHTMAFGTGKIFMPAHGSVVFPVLHTCMRTFRWQFAITVELTCVCAGVL